MIQDRPAAHYVLEIDEVVREGHKPRGVGTRRVLVLEEQKVKTYACGTLEVMEYSLRLLRLKPGCRWSDAAIHSFDASYHHTHQTVKLTSHGLIGGYVLLDDIRVMGDRLGTYLMNRIVGWAKHWPDAEVWPIHLDKGHAIGENKERRNRFYEQFGIRFDFDDPTTRESGRSHPMKVHELVQVDPEKYRNIREVPLDVFLGDMESTVARLRGDVDRLQRVNAELARDWTQMIKRPFATALQLTFSGWRWRLWRS